jgi:hypothetical protein
MQKLKAHSASEKRQVDDQRIKTATESIDFARGLVQLQANVSILGTIPHSTKLSDWNLESNGSWN